MAKLVRPVMGSPRKIARGLKQLISEEYIDEEDLSDNIDEYVESYSFPECSSSNVIDKLNFYSELLDRDEAIEFLKEYDYDSYFRYPREDEEHYF